MKITFLTGAGISQESGIPTYRDNDGMWKKFNPEEVASSWGWKQNPQKCIEFFNQARDFVKSKQPNKAHNIITELQDIFQVYVITQNVDNLHEKAGSKNILHIHGELFKNILPNQMVEPSFEPIQNPPTRPDVVLFGERVKHLSTAIQYVKKSDIIVVVGTSLEVYPFSSLLDFISTDKIIFIIDPNPPQKFAPNIIHIEKKATEGMVELRSILFQEKF